MSKYIATRAIRGANAIVAEADALLKKAIAEKGAETPVVFPNTAYFCRSPTGCWITRLKRWETWNSR